MILLALGSRPEMVKFMPLIREFDLNSYPYKTLFTGQQKDLVKEFKSDYSFKIIDDENRLDSIVASCMNEITNMDRMLKIIEK
jgi:UDP-N-acetylglucosamine 2-epimerase